MDECDIEGAEGCLTQVNRENINYTVHKLRAKHNVYTALSTECCLCVLLFNRQSNGIYGKCVFLQVCVLTDAECVHYVMTSLHQQ